MLNPALAKVRKLCGPLASLHVEAVHESGVLLASASRDDNGSVARAAEAHVLTRPRPGLADHFTFPLACTVSIPGRRDPEAIFLFLAAENPQS